MPSTMEAVVAATAKHFKIDGAKLLAEHRTPYVSHARHVAMYMMRVRLWVSFGEIALHFRRDRGSAIQAVKKIDRIAKTDSGLYRDLAAIERILDGGAP